MRREKAADHAENRCISAGGKVRTPPRAHTTWPPLPSGAPMPCSMCVRIGCASKIWPAYAAMQKCNCMLVHAQARMMRMLFVLHAGAICA